MFTNYLKLLYNTKEEREDKWEDGKMTNMIEIPYLKSISLQIFFRWFAERFLQTFHPEFCRLQVGKASILLWLYLKKSPPFSPPVLRSVKEWTNTLISMFLDTLILTRGKDTLLPLVYWRVFPSFCLIFSFAKIFSSALIDLYTCFVPTLFLRL